MTKSWWGFAVLAAFLLGATPSFADDCPAPGNEAEALVRQIQAAVIAAQHQVEAVIRSLSPPNPSDEAGIRAYQAILASLKRMSRDATLGGCSIWDLVQVELPDAPPSDAGRVPYPPMRVSLEETEKKIDTHKLDLKLRLPPLPFFHHPED